MFTVSSEIRLEFCKVTVFVQISLAVSSPLQGVARQFYSLMCATVIKCDSGISVVSNPTYVMSRSRPKLSEVDFLKIKQDKFDPGEMSCGNTVLKDQTVYSRFLLGNHIHHCIHVVCRI